MSLPAWSALPILSSVTLFRNSGAKNMYLVGIFIKDVCRINVIKFEAFSNFSTATATEKEICHARNAQTLDLACCHLRSVFCRTGLGRKRDRPDSTADSQTSHQHTGASCYRKYSYFSQKQTEKCTKTRLLP
ncbi:MAG: hypothetical protein I8H91_03960 [Burkholderiales bacterium]|nr:hypothetical protein [Burkholderiales bacterium]